MYGEVMENNAQTVDEDTSIIADSESDAGLDIADAVESKSSITPESKKAERKKVKNLKKVGWIPFLPSMFIPKEPLYF